MVDAIGGVNNGIQPVTDPGVVVRLGDHATIPEISKPKGRDSQEVAGENLTAADVRTAVTKLNVHVQNLRRTLAFSIDESTGRTIIRVYDTETQELIRAIPPDETIRMVQEIERYNNSHLIHGQLA